MSKKHLMMKEVMTEQAHTVRNSESVDTAQELMTRFGVRHLPVLDGGRLVGVLSERDIRIGLSYKGANAKTMTVEDVCSPDVYTTHPDSEVDVVSMEMAEKRYGCAVVTDGPGKVVGIFTTTDACRALAQVLNPALATN